MIGPRHRGAQREPLAPSAPPTEDSFGRVLLHGITEVVVVLAMALALSLVIKTFFVQAFRIPSESMQNTLLIGDRVIVNKLTPGPFALHRGDVVVFKDPGGWLSGTEQPVASGITGVTRSVLTFVGLLPSDSGQHLIKRVIGLPGDTVECCDAQGRLMVNGVAINESYLFPDEPPSAKTFKETVPEGRLWVMGDHRSVSWDSRFQSDPFVPIDNVVGKALVIVWPLSRIGGVTSAGSAFDGVP